MVPIILPLIDTLRLGDRLITNVFVFFIDQCKHPDKSIKNLDVRQNDKQEDNRTLDITRRKRKADADRDGGQLEQEEKLHFDKKPRVCFRFSQIKQL